MADNKWMGGLASSTPLADAARRVLQLRLAGVGERLPPALLEPDKDQENVHQLRVASRRAGAALRTFRRCFADKAYRWVRRRLRRVRRAAGAARDADVFLATLMARTRRAAAGQRPGLDFLLGYSRGQRVAAQEHLLAANQPTALSWHEFLQRTLAALQPPTTLIQSLGDLAGFELPRLVRELAEAASCDLQPYEHLHRVRILGKRLRYAMEIFSGCYEAPFREVYYPSVEAMQDILGLANDSYEACQKLAEVRAHLQSTRPRDWRRLGPGIEAVFQFHEQRLPQQRRKFERWWRQWQKASAETAFTHMLKHSRKGA
jgi:CHAD domain-containing protein